MLSDLSLSFLFSVGLCCVSDHISQRVITQHISKHGKKIQEIRRFLIFCCDLPLCVVVFSDLPLCFALQGHRTLIFKSTIIWTL